MKYEQKDNQFVISEVTLPQLLILRHGLKDELKSKKEIMYKVVSSGNNKEDGMPIARKYIDDLENEIKELESFIDELRKGWES